MKSVTTNFSWLPGRQFSASSNIGFFQGSFIWGPSNIPALCFSMLIRGKFSWRKTKPLSPLSIAFTKFYITLNWYVRLDAAFCSVQREDEIERYTRKVLTLVLTVSLAWHNVGRQPGCPIEIEQKDTLCTHLGALGKGASGGVMVSKLD